jgi:hypothetical protein
MPPVSEAQRRWAFANKDKKTAEGRAAAEYAAADRGGKLPARVGKTDEDRKRGRYGKKG